MDSLVCICTNGHGYPQALYLHDLCPVCDESMVSMYRQVVHVHKFESDLRYDGRTCDICGSLPGGVTHS